MTVDEFTALLRTHPLEDIVQTRIFEGAPVLFEQNPESYGVLRAHLSTRREVEAPNVVIVGSAQTGFSLRPESYGRPFRAESDVDVIVVDAAIFDQIWFTLLRWDWPLTRPVPRLDLRWGQERRNEVYWGWFVPSAIRVRQLSFAATLRPLRDLSTRWFSAFRAISLNRDLGGRDYKGRLYRTWDHARLYHVNGLRQVVAQLPPVTGETA